MNPEIETNTVDQLAEEFAERLRQGEAPSIEEYAERHPQHEEDIRELFPAILAIEEMIPHQQKAPRRRFDCPVEELGEFRILREIGRGGMGIVFEAEQRSLGRIVALKILPPGPTVSETQRERFQREAQCAARLHHSNIVPVFVVGEEQGIPYFAMQRIQGCGLHQVLNALRHASDGGRPVSDHTPTLLAEQLVSGSFISIEKNKDALEKTDALEGTVSTTSVLQGSISTSKASQFPNLKTVAQFGAQIADALSYAHERGVLHRDIKPSNLHLDHQGTIWVMDFGLATDTELSDLTASGDVVGTLRYLAPERFQGRADARSDLYSLGLTLYEMASLRPAFDVIDQADLLQQVMRAEPVPLRELNPAISKDLETIILKCLSKEPGRRYHSARELHEDLTAFLQNRPIRARRPGILEQAWLWARDQPAKASAVLLAFLALMALTGLIVRWSYSIDLERANASLQQSEKQLASSLKNEKSANAKADRLLNLNRLLLAHREWQNDNPLAARQLLSLCPKEKRNWEWHYLNRLVHSSEKAAIVTGIEAPVRLQVSDSGRWLCCACDRSLFLFDISTKTRSVISGRVYFDAAFALSPDDRWLAVAPSDKTIRLWDLGRSLSAEPDVTINLEHRASALVFNRDSGSLYSITDRGRTSAILQHEIASRKVQSSWILKGKPDLVALSPGGDWFAVAGPSTRGGRGVWVWSTKTGRVVLTVPCPGLKGRFKALRFSKEGDRLCMVGLRLRIRDLSTGKVLKQQVLTDFRNGLKSPPSHWGVCVNSELTCLAVWERASSTVRILRIADGREITRFRGRGGVASVLLGDVENEILVGNFMGEARSWKLSADQRFHKFNIPAGRLLGIDEKGRPLIGNRLGAQDGMSGKVVMPNSTREPFTDLAVSRNCKRIATLSTSVQVRSTKTGHVVWSCPLHIKPRETLDAHKKVTISPDGTLVAFVDRVNQKRVIQVFDCEQSDPICTSPHPPGQLVALRLSSDNLYLAVGTTRTVQLIHLKRNTTKTWPGSLRAPYAEMAFSPDARLFAWANGGHRVEVHDLAMGCRLFITPHAAYSDLAFSHDGTRLATFDTTGTVRLWDVDGGSLTFELTAQSLHGRHHLTFGFDSKLWVAGKDELLSFDGSEIPFSNLRGTRERR